MRRPPGSQAGRHALDSPSPITRTEDAVGELDGRAVLEAGPIRVDVAGRSVTVDGRAVDLTPTEFKLLETLLRRRGQAQSRPQLLERVWRARGDMRTRTVDMHVRRLRAKLGPAAPHIETVRGFGYRLQDTP
ncbi:MAG: winged helix-turn-helix transcriptional regulator [Gemmatimonadota bacterium]|nr:MAG: winged helix-turn-helix transcriptional regulator [Gemmatimonadota bacterium]